MHVGHLVFGANKVSIDLSTGEVTVDKDVPLSEAAQAFWNAVKIFNPANVHPSPSSDWKDAPENGTILICTPKDKRIDKILSVYYCDEVEQWCKICSGEPVENIEETHDWYTTKLNRHFVKPHLPF